MESINHKNHLHFYRIQREKSLADMGMIFGMYSETYKKIELGLKSPSMDQAWRMADFFGLELHELFFREGQKPELRVIVQRKRANQQK